MEQTGGVATIFPQTATTGIGSLPHAQIEAALDLSARHDLPFLPQLPAGRPLEAMIPSAIEGLPGLTVGGDGGCVIDAEGWRRKRDSFALAIHAALASRQLGAFAPTPDACRCFEPFLARLGAHRARFAKVQLAGPATVRWAVKLSTGEPVSELAELDEQLFQLLLARSLALVRAVARTGAKPIFFLDEPGLVALAPSNPRHQLVLKELEVLIQALKAEGAIVGLHCCGNTAWYALLGLGLDVLSFDARLSLDAVLEEREACARFLTRGATFALGVVPTEPGAHYVLGELVDSIEVSLRAAAPRGLQIGGLLKRMLLSSACGLATHPIAEAERIVGEVFQAQTLLRRASGEVDLGEHRARG